MSYSLIVENYRGETLQLTQNPNYNVTSVEGMNPPKAQINTSENAVFDGTTFNSSKLDERNIVIELTIEGNAEANRIALYRYFKTKKAVTLHIANGTRSVYINGYVESFDVGYFEKKQTAQISILCPKPCFVDDSSSGVMFSNINALFEFPFSIEAGDPIEFSTLVSNVEKNVFNSGDIATGFIIQFRATGETTNPTFYNVMTAAMMKVNIALSEGDIVVINTLAGEKSVSLTVNGVTTNALNDLDPSSTWLELESGDNVFLYTADTYPENLVCDVIYSNLFEGV